MQDPRVSESFYSLLLVLSPVASKGVQGGGSLPIACRGAGLPTPARSQQLSTATWGALAHPHAAMARRPVRLPVHS
jgi:hypothetical protein